MSRSLTGNRKLVKLLTLFEKELRLYHRCFSGSDFYLEYDVEKTIQNEYIIQPRFFITSENIWNHFIDEKWGINDVISQYCNLFSFEFRVLKNRSRTKNYPPRLPVEKETIEMRLNFNFIISIKMEENI